MPASLAFERLKQEDYEEFEDSLGYTANSKPARDLWQGLGPQTKDDRPNLRRLCLSRVGPNETEQRIMVGGWTESVVHCSNASYQKGQTGKQSLKLAWAAWRDPV